jgi:hypothetical protein
LTLALRILALVFGFRSLTFTHGRSQEFLFGEPVSKSPLEQELLENWGGARPRGYAHVFTTSLTIPVFSKISFFKRGHVTYSLYTTYKDTVLIDMDNMMDKVLIRSYHNGDAH